MRIILTFITTFITTIVMAQTNLPGSITQDNATYSTFHAIRNLPDSITPKKWFVSKYSSISTGYVFFHGGGARFLAVPIGLQLNRRLGNNIYAFAGVSIVPEYLSFNRTFLATDITKTNGFNGFYQPGNLSINPAVSLGLMYVNDARTFSISGSVSVEKSSYPLLYNYQSNISNQNKIIPYSR